MTSRDTVGLTNSGNSCGSPSRLPHSCKSSPINLQEGIFCDCALLSRHTTCELHGGEPGHALHSGAYRNCNSARQAAAVFGTRLALWCHETWRQAPGGTLEHTEEEKPCHGPSSWKENAMRTLCPVAYMVFLAARGAAHLSLVLDRRRRMG